MAVVNVMFGGGDPSEEINEAVAAETSRAQAAEQAINDKLDGVEDLLSQI